MFQQYRVHITEVWDGPR